jgi:hypothetical protein
VETVKIPKSEGPESEGRAKVESEDQKPKVEFLLPRKGSSAGVNIKP